MYVYIYIHTNYSKWSCIAKLIDEPQKRAQGSGFLNQVLQTAPPPPPKPTPSPNHSQTEPSPRPNIGA